MSAITSRNRRRYLAGLVAPLCALALGAAARAAASPAGTGSTDKSTGKLDIQAALQAVGQRDWPSKFGGLVAENNDQQLAVYLKGGTPAAEEAMRAGSARRVPCLPHYAA